MSSPPPSSRRSPYVQLLLVFGFAWLLLGAYALSQRDIVVLGARIARSEIATYFGVARAAEPDELAAEELGADVETGAGGAGLGAGGGVADGAEHPAEPVPAAAAPVDSGGVRVVDEAPQRILIFGDSMVQSIQPRLGDYCLENGHKLLPAVWYASTTVAWGVQHKLDQLINEFKPTMVIAVLGSSEISTRKVEERDKFVRAILKKVGRRKFVWIGPPNWREDTGINALLERELGKGRFFRSAELELDRIEDKIHPTPAGGVKWTEAFLGWLRDESAYPILLATPTRTAPKIPARVYPPPY
ncbi:MAG: hypothetical protein HY908_10630 [Myxococcales bacterium]|nr:hypothetical protein [Myxococcales bacterium]